MKRTLVCVALLVLTTAPVGADEIQDCPIPDPEAIAGHESVFYTCAEDVLGCGDDGYFLGYGARYAERFYRETRPTMSARGRLWIDDVLVCLQDELRGSIDTGTSCADVRTIAFDSHPGCYVEAGFCTLPLSDIWKVATTVDAVDWLSADAARQLITTAARCSRSHAFWMALLFGGGY